MSQRDRRHPHRELDTSVIAEFLAGRELLSADLLRGGKTNGNYRLRLSGGAQCVVRLLNRGDAALEAHMLSVASDVVAVPNVLASGDGWLVLAYIEGRALRHTPEDLRLAGQALAGIRSVRYKQAGWLEADGSIATFDFPEGDFTSAMLARSDVREWLGGSLTDDLTLLMARTEHLRGGLSDPRLVHGDFNASNILVSDGRIAAVLDWEFAHAGTRWMDIGNLLRDCPPDLQAHVREGLEAGGAVVPEDWQMRAELVDLSSALEFLTSGRSDAFKRQCVARVRRTVQRSGN